MQKDGQKIWGTICADIKSQVSASTYKTWFLGSFVLNFKQTEAEKQLVVADRFGFYTRSLSDSIKLLRLKAEQSKDIGALSNPDVTEEFCGVHTSELVHPLGMVKVSLFEDTICGVSNIFIRACPSSGLSLSKITFESF